MTAADPGRAVPDRAPVALDTTLRRIIVGYRAVAAVWFTSLALITLIREEPTRPPIVVAAIAVVLVWTTVTLGLSYRAPFRLRQWPFLLLDLAITVGLLLAPGIAGASDFYGGYPISTVLIGVYGLGWSGGTVAVVVLTSVAIGRGLAGSLTGDATGITGAIVVYPFIAAPVIWAVGVLRRSDRLRREAETALEIEKADRARAEERADLAAHLHDSVLQTLAVIQRRSTLPDEVVSLARGQERDLRAWLYGSSGDAESLEAALSRACAEVETTYHIPIDLVVVGAPPMTPGLDALVSAAREAVVNAARHSGAPTVSVYAEAEPGVVRVFVRDRGAGFDPGSVPADRQGLANSIVGRMQRHGGEALVVSKPGTGTEITLTMPV